MPSPARPFRAISGSQASQKFSFHQEAVHDLGDASIFSALAVDGENRFSVVDVWRKQGDGHKLAVRYLCPSTGAKPVSTIRKRY